MKRATIGLALGLLGALLMIAPSRPAQAVVEPTTEVALDLVATLEPGSESVLPRITFRALFEQGPLSTGYDLSVSWNPEVLRIHPGVPLNLLDASSASAMVLNPLRTRVAAIRPEPAETRELFEMSFDVLTAGAGWGDFRVFVDLPTNGVGIGVPADTDTLSVANPNGLEARILGAYPEALDVVLRLPEPSGALCAVMSLVLIACLAGRGKKAAS